MAKETFKAYLTGKTEDTTPDPVADFLIQYDTSAAVIKKSKFNNWGLGLSGNQTAAGVKTFSSSPIVPTPAGATDAANKGYVDGVVAGLSWKQMVRAATTAAGTLASSFENGDTIDGVVLATNDRILIKNQAAATENGIYTVNASGAPTRSTDADVGSELVNASCYVAEGTANADTQWVCTTNSPITIGATNITFAQFSAGSSGLTMGTTASDGTVNTILKTNGSGKVNNATGLTTAAGQQLIATAQSATDIPSTIQLAAAQSGNAFNITANGGGAGGVFNISAGGQLNISGRIIGSGSGNFIGWSDVQFGDILGTGESTLNYNSGKGVSFRDNNGVISARAQTSGFSALSIQTSLAPTTSQIVAAGYGTYIPYQLEIPAGVTYEVGAGAVLEIG